MQKPMVAYACTTPPPIPPSRPAVPGLTPRSIVRFSISAAVKRRTPPLVDASIHALYETRLAGACEECAGGVSAVSPWNQALVDCAGEENQLSVGCARPDSKRRESDLLPRIPPLLQTVAAAAGMDWDL